MTPEWAIHRAFGCPYHGLVRGGKLQLPNGQEFSYPQPDNGNSFPIAVPGLPNIVRAPEEAAADAAQGLQWKKTAIAAGALDLHGRGIGGARSWVYIDSTTFPWVISFAAVSASGNAATLAVTCKRLFSFGPFTVTEKTFSVSITDCGLNSVHATGAGAINLEDVDLNGARVLLKVAGVINNASSGTSSRAYSFLLLQVSDDGADDIQFTITPGVVKSQADCLPVLTGDDTIDSTETDADGPRVDTTSGTDACGPYEEYTGITAPGAFSWETGTITDQDVSKSYAFSSIGHTVGAFFKGDGAIVYISYDLEVQGQLDRIWSNTSVGFASAHGPACGGVTGSITQTRHVDDTSLETLRYTIHVGTESQRFEWKIEIEGSGEHKRDLNPFYGPGQTSSGLYGGTGSSLLSESITGLGTFTDSQVLSGPSAIFSFGIWFAVNWSQIFNSRGTICEQYGFVGFDPSIELTIGTRRWTNKLAGLLWRVTVGLWSTPEYALGEVAGHVFAPDAKDTGTFKIFEDTGKGDNCSYEPFTFAITRNDPQAVNYV